jgi:hypothetical protein
MVINSLIKIVDMRKIGSSSCKYITGNSRKQRVGWTLQARSVVARVALDGFSSEETSAQRTLVVRHVAYNNIIVMSMWLG